MKQKHCRYCGQFFIPDKRLGDRQKSCGRPECRKKRKKESQVAWFKKNPTYFKERYDETRAWLAANPGYLKRRRKKLRDIQDSLPHVTPMKSIRLLMPVNLLKSDIQDTSLILTQIDSATYAARCGG